MKETEGNDFDWRIEWIMSMSCELWYVTNENEVWRNKNNRIVVWHPTLGLRMMFHATNMSEKVQMDIIEKILSDQQKKIDQKKDLKEKLQVSSMI